MDNIISARNAREICAYHRLLPTFRRIYDKALHCEYELKDERLYNSDAVRLEELGYKVRLTGEHKSGINEYEISW